MYEAILSAKANTEKLIYELKTLYHGIRSYLRKLQGQRDINILLRDHFDEYKALADRIYHPIKTMDSVYRYMAPIRQMLTAVLGNAEILESMRKRAMAIRRYDSEDEAGREIINAIDYVLDIYRSLGAIVSEIDKKHSSYTKLSVDTIRYHMSADQTMSGKLISLLKEYAAGSGSRQEELLGLMQRKVRINRQEFFDGSDGSRLSDTDTDRLMKSMRNDYSLQHIKQFMSTLFGDKDYVSTEDVDIADDRAFILLILSAIRAGERNTDFKAQVGDGGLMIDGYRIPKMAFTRTGGRAERVE
jgi:hypothetical protein